jgi:ApaG protein
MSLKKITNLNIQIDIATVYVPQESDPANRHYFFAYKISIKNLGQQSAQLMSRHWIITDAFGRSEEVRGPGVVGLQPKILPQQSFEYESACPLTTNTGSMRGFYHFLTEDGETVPFEISEFFLVAPQAIH